MSELLDFEMPEVNSSLIKVIGVGGGGCNAVNYMYNQGIKDVNFVVCNTDAQALNNSPIPNRLHLGSSLTGGRGAGAKPEVGCQSAIENLKDIEMMLSDHTKMVFVTAGMGGGTGTGAAPVIAKTAKEMGILTVGIVTIPFIFEGKSRINQALDGVEEMQKYVDALLVINNAKLREIYGNQTLSEAFSKADNVLSIAAKGIAEIITVHGYINVDFADVETVMRNSGVAIMGSGVAEGEDRAITAIKNALVSPLLNNNDISGAKNILLNITSFEPEITMDEVGQITDFVKDSVGDEASIIWGTGNDERLGGNVNVTIIATGFNISSIPEMVEKHSKQNKRFTLEGKKEITPDEQLDGENPGKDRVVDFTSMKKNEEVRIGLFYGNQNKEKKATFLPDDAETGVMEFGIKSRLSYEDLNNDELLHKLEAIPAYRRKNYRAEN